MYTEKTIQHEGAEFVVIGTKDCDMVGFMCDGCGNTCNGTLTILRERAQTDITFWCADCVQVAQAGR